MAVFLTRLELCELEIQFLAFENALGKGKDGYSRLSMLYHFDFQMHLFCGNIKDAISPKSLDIIWRFLCPRK